MKKMINSVIKNLKPYIDQIGDNKKIEPILKEGMVYSLLGGKSVRALLLERVVYDIDPKMVSPSLYRVAFSIELIHNYSLIHDDLPAIDNDEIRRDKPTVHKKFGEDIAIVVGDALGGYAFEQIALSNFPDDIKIKLIIALSKAAGPEGMISGQILDMRYPPKTLKELERLHNLKTGKMIQLPIKMGTIITSPSDEIVKNLKIYGKNIGLAFQAKDDLLDIIGDEKIVGKKLRKDSKQNKVTYIDFLGVDGTKREINRLIDEAIEIITPFKFNNLIKIANFLKNRVY